jgi:hypothetical protein
MVMGLAIPGLLLTVRVVMPMRRLMVVAVHHLSRSLELATGECHRHLGRAYPAPVYRLDGNPDIGESQPGGQ